MRRSATQAEIAPYQPAKLPFDIGAVMRALRRATRALRKAALFELHDGGYRTVFQQLVACIISIRTFDEVTVPAARKLFAQADTPQAVAALSEAQIDALIDACTFHRPKSRTIRQIALAAVQRFAGELPCDYEVLTSFAGVGPKCANLALGIACDRPHGVGVDIHVHRVTNRWGYVQAGTPEKTMAQLEQKLPRKYWVEINRVLVPFGKHICTGRQPRCSRCPVLAYCRQVGVGAHR